MTSSAHSGQHPHYAPPRRTHPRQPGTGDLEHLVSREWLVTNGIGGYASGTVAGVTTRRYHGVLVAALPNPLGRTVMCSQVFEACVGPTGETHLLNGVERVGARLDPAAAPYLEEFRLEGLLPVWRYRVGDTVFERRVVMPYRQNTTIVSYHVVDGDEVALVLRPSIHFRSYEDAVSTPFAEGYRFSTCGDVWEVEGPGREPPLRLAADGAAVDVRATEERYRDLLYRVEAARGYGATGELLSPAAFHVVATRERPASIVASTESRETMLALGAPEAWDAEQERRRRLVTVLAPGLREGVAAELALAADQFVIAPAGRVSDAVRAWAVGDEVRTIIAGYHWFTDWGRDTMIALEGLTLATGRYREASAILRAFAQHVRDGLIPNMFPDGSDEGLYHTADATLWFFHALARFQQYTGDATLVRQLLPVMQRIADAHIAGTRFGIAVDAADGLLRQGAEGYQLTWMDAKVDGWVVTPRRGKAVEINALWYNALCHLERWLRDEGRTGDADRYAAHAARAHASFNARFWRDDLGHLLDVVDGPDGDEPLLRPNQLFAIALDHPVLNESHWRAVVDACERTLLTPVGLRSLAPGSPEYRERYFGDLRTRDGAYHQGTVWGWLIGPWIDAWLRVHPGQHADARRFLDGLVAHLDEFGVGSLAEIFDAEAPYEPRGCIAQAWSVAEALRCWKKTAGDGSGSVAGDA